MAPVAAGDRYVVDRQIQAAPVAPFFKHCT
jgi:hypothetical protein